MVEESLFIVEPNTWTLYFDGAKNQSGAEVGFFFRTPKDNTLYFTFRLDLECTNNFVEYEALILGLCTLLDRVLPTNL